MINIDFDYFYYYGLSEIEKETEHDLMLLLLHPRKSLFYDRSEGAGVFEYQNYPNALSLQIGLRYNIAMSLAKRNANVTNGVNNTKDRRVAASQFSVQFNQDQDGNLDVMLYYYLYSNLSNPLNINLPVGKI